MLLDFQLQKLAKMERRFLELENQLSLPEVTSNSREFKKLSKERSELFDPISNFIAFKNLKKQMEDCSLLLTDASTDMAELAALELETLEIESKSLQEALVLALLPKDPNDSRNVLLEIRAGAGGDEASLFASELFRGYTRFVEGLRWKIEIMSQSENELGGLKEIIAFVEGENVYQKLKYESGVHRVQRVPSTETQGRIHTSTITVAVLPEAEDVEISVNESDLRIDTYRASGAGGQHVNRTDSAVRITHIPSGVVIACQDERSQIKNRAKAMKILKAKLLEHAQIEHDKAISEERRSQVGRGDRSERIRTYNFPQSRITDHRINVTTHAISDFMEGDMEDLLDKVYKYYLTQEMARLARTE